MTELSEFINPENNGTFESVEIIQPTEAGQKAAAEALEAIKDRSFAGRNPELGRMINCVHCGFRHRENQNGRSNADPCQEKFAKIDEVEQIAGETKHTKSENLIEAEIPRKQQRIIFGAKRVKGRRKQLRNRPRNPLTHWQRILIAKVKKEASNGSDHLPQ